MKKSRGLEFIDSLFGFNNDYFEDEETENYGFKYGYYYEEDEDFLEKETSKDSWLD